MSKEAMKLALEALEANSLLVNGNNEKWGLVGCMDGYYSVCFDIDPINKQTNEAITALREALAEQPAQHKPLNREQEIALREGYFADAEKAYFESKAYFINTAHNRKLFEAGFNRGYEAALGIKGNT